MVAFTAAPIRETTADTRWRPWCAGALILAAGKYMKVRREEQHLAAFAVTDETSPSITVPLSRRD